jgi:hypothetical protein
VDWRPSTDRSDHLQPRPYSPLSTSSWAWGLTEVHEHPVAHLLGDEAAKTIGEPVDPMVAELLWGSTSIGSFVRVISAQSSFNRNGTTA